MILTGKVIVPGRVEGEVLKVNGSFSFLGGVDPESGIVRDINKSIKDKIFVFESSAGSTVGSYIIYGLKFYKNAPLALICKYADETVIIGANIAKIPTITNIDVSLIENGDRIKIDNEKIEINIEPTEVVTSILMNSNKILILKRSDKVSTYRGKWAGVSGYKEDLEPEKAALREIVEETGINDPKLKKYGGYMLLRDKNKLWKIHIFLWEVNEKEIKIDWEHTEYRWIDPKKIDEYDTVPGLKEVINRLI